MFKEVMSAVFTKEFTIGLVGLGVACWFLAKDSYNLGRKSMTTPLNIMNKFSRELIDENEKLKETIQNLQNEQ